MKGALPVPYIVALVIALVVIALLAYWFFILGGQGRGEADRNLCLAERLAKCSEWALTGYDGEWQNKEENDMSQKCKSAYPDIRITQDACRGALGQTTTTLQ